MLTRSEKEYLARVVEKELKELKESKKGLFIGMSMEFLKAEHDYGYFLENIIAKLKNEK